MTGAYLRQALRERASLLVPAAMVAIIIRVVMDASAEAVVVGQGIFASFVVLVTILLVSRRAFDANNPWVLARPLPRRALVLTDRLADLLIFLACVLVVVIMLGAEHADIYLGRTDWNTSVWFSALLVALAVYVATTAGLATGRPTINALLVGLTWLVLVVGLPQIGVVISYPLAARQVYDGLILFKRLALVASAVFATGFALVFATRQQLDAPVHPPRGALARWGLAAMAVNLAVLPLAYVVALLATPRYLRQGEPVEFVFVDENGEPTRFFGPVLGPAGSRPDDDVRWRMLEHPRSARLLDRLQATSVSASIPTGDFAVCVTQIPAAVLEHERLADCLNWLNHREPLRRQCIDVSIRDGQTSIEVELAANSWESWRQVCCAENAELCPEPAHDR